MYSDNWSSFGNCQRNLNESFSPGRSVVGAVLMFENSSAAQREVVVGG